MTTAPAGGELGEQGDLTPPFGGPEITRVRYDARTLSVSWKAWSNPATTFTIIVRRGKATVAHAEAGHVMNGWLPLELPDDGADYTVVVQAHQGQGQPEPESWPVRIITATTAVESATTDPVTGAVKLSWAGTATDRFQLRLSVNGAPPDPESLITGTSATVPALQPPGCVVAASLAQTAVDNDALSIGPYGPGFAVPTERPDLAATAYDGASLHAAWTPVTAATGYRLSVLQGAAVATSTDVAAPLTVATAKVALDAGQPWRAVVQALFATGSGPASAPVDLVAAAPAIASTTCDGATLAVALTPPAGVTPTAYDWVVRRANAPTPLRAATEPPAATLDLPADWRGAPGAPQAISVRARVGVATGPEAAAPVLTGCPEVAAITCVDKALTVTAAAGPLPKAGLSIDAALVVNGAMGPPQRVGPDGTTVFAVPTGDPAVAVVVRGVTGVATGPWSAPAAALVAVPSITAAQADDSRVALAWTGPSTGQYQVAVKADGATTAETVVRGVSAALALPDPAPASGNVAAAVTQFEGVAIGPTGSIALIALGPSLDAATVGPHDVVTLPWTAAPGPAVVSGVEAVARWEGNEHVWPVASPAVNPLILTLPETVPNGAVVALRAIANQARGPLGNGCPLLTVAPRGLAVAYDGATVTAAWDAATDPPVDRYAVTFLAPDQSPVVQLVREPFAQFPYRPNTRPATPPTVSVEAMAGETVRGVACTPVEIVVDAPAITKAVHDGQALAVAWSAVADAAATAYRLAVTSNGVPVQELDVGGTEAVVPVPAGSWAVAVQATGADADGPMATLPVITQAPDVDGIAFDAATGDCTVSWTAVPHATAYAVVLRNGADSVDEQQVAAPATTHTFPASDFAAGGGYSVVVRATASTGQVQVEGPPSDAAAVVAAVPARVDAVYDGVEVRASWQAVDRPETTGYRVSTLADGVVAHLGDTTDTRGAWPLRKAPVGGPALVVQALAGSDTGAPSAPADLFPESLFVGGTGPGAYLAPQQGPTLSPREITLSLPDLGVALSQPQTFALLGFVLAPATGDFGATLTIPASSPVWVFASRIDMADAWRKLASWLQNTVKASPAGVIAVQDALSRAVPQTFAESLLFAYGLSFPRACFDLRPGLVIRVESEAYMTAAGTDQGNLSGFVTSAAADYDVAAYLSADTLANGLDAFLGALASQGVKVTAPGPVGTAPSARYGGGGVLDTFALDYRLPFCRIVYPLSFLTSTVNGSLMPQLNAVLLAAKSVDALETATDNVRKSLPPGSGVAAVYLRGRTVIRPLVRVWVDGVARLVSAGTTVGDVLAAEGRRPPATSRPLRGVSVVRARGAAVTDAAPAADAAAGRKIRLDWSPGNQAGLAVPLLHGDRLDFDGDDWPTR